MCVCVRVKGRKQGSSILKRKWGMSIHYIVHMGIDISEKVLIGKCACGGSGDTGAPSKCVYEEGGGVEGHYKVSHSPTCFADTTFKAAIQYKKMCSSGILRTKLACEDDQTVIPLARFSDAIFAGSLGFCQQWRQKS